MLAEAADGAHAAISYQPLIGIGAVGWVALLLLPPLFRGEIGAFCAALIPAIVIFECGSVLPSSLAESQAPARAIPVLWVLAVAPYLMLALTIWKKYRNRRSAKAIKSSVFTL